MNECGGEAELESNVELRWGRHYANPGTSHYRRLAAFHIDLEKRAGILEAKTWNNFKIALRSFRMLSNKNLS